MSAGKPAPVLEMALPALDDKVPPLHNGGARVCKACPLGGRIAARRACYAQLLAA